VRGRRCPWVGLGARGAGAVCLKTEQLAEKSRGQRWTVFFPETVQDSTFERGAKWIFVDFRMPGVSATCCGVNLSAPAPGVLCFFARRRGRRQVVKAVRFQKTCRA
jgi:hypothetical protein